MKHILVVDDLPEIRFVYLELLKSSDRKIIEAGDGREALGILEQSKIDLVLTDCQMPYMTGVELMWVAKDRFPDLPFLVVSSTAQPEDLEGLDPIAVMPKPFRLADLKSAVDDALNQ